MDRQVKLEDLNVNELLSYERAARAVGEEYEKYAKNYANKIVSDEHYKGLTDILEIHSRIIDELEKRLRKLC
jgi:hypothetical protein